MASGNHNDGASDHASTTGPTGPMSSPSPAWLPPALAGAEPASLLRRVGGIAIDWLASIILARIIFPGAEYGSSASALATLAIFAIEVTAFTWLIGSSFGQRLVGIMVVAANGGRLSLWRCLVRTLLICLVIPALVYDSKRRGLQDLAVGSLVLVRRTVPGVGR